MMVPAPRHVSSRRARSPERRPGQGLVEFALILPVLLLVLFGIIEFARILQAWLSVENGARFGVRYAVTGEYNTAYCDPAFLQAHVPVAQQPLFATYSADDHQKKKPGSRCND